MSTPKHTPGPWSAFEENVYGPDQAHIAAADIGWGDGDPAGVAFANAALIAQAPTMREQLDRLAEPGRLAELEALLNIFELGPDVEPLLRTLLTDLRAAAPFNEGGTT